MRESLLHTGSISLDLERQVDQLCDEFEDALKRGIVPDAEEYLARLHGSAHRSFLHEITKLLRAYSVSGISARDSRALSAAEDSAIAKGSSVDKAGPNDVGDTTRAYLRRSLEFLEQIDDAGTRFEQALSRGELLRIEEVVNAVDAEARPRLLRDLLNLEMEFRAKKGESPSLREYRARFPHEARLVKHVYLAHFLPTKIGDFVIHRLLGRGGFGQVYQGWDPKLSRNVAIKVFHREPNDTAAPAGGLLFEARSAAQLQHPGIVAVHAVLLDEDGDEFLVLDYVDGSSLEDELRTRRMSPHEAAALLLAVVQALGHSHDHGLIHCDLKPANILLDQGRRPRVTDFGVALHMRSLSRSPDVAGTLPYMAPEQAAGETHRLDARTDLWAVGVILYRALTGWLPFAGASRQELLETIRHREPKDVLTHDPTIPIELARIVNRCLAKQMSERYQSAAELADDLRALLTPKQQRDPVDASAGDQSLRAVVPKGLRCFDESDQDFFLQLVPGPRDRRGVPEAVRFWETRLRETDAHRTFRVGLVYGPSGCGKSSLVRAGVLPRLQPKVHVLMIEATRDETELRLTRDLRRLFPEIPSDLPLADALAKVREGWLLAPGEKLLIVLDQFEQWLHGRRHDGAAILIDALRQCDGGRVQALVLIRDDFWTPATRFFKRLDVGVVDGQNASAVDLFDEAHATAVLGAFGAAHGRLPADQSQRTTDQQRFIECAVKELSDDGWIVPIRLCILVEKVKSRPWTAVTLRDMGGAGGLGTAFLEEVFDSRTALPRHRLFRNAARNALEQLLPPPGCDIRGHSVCETELRAASGYENEPKEFAALLQCLDQELRLVTPSDSEVSVSTDAAGELTTISERRYQLTHDFLVIAIRGWLNQTRRQTIWGRAHLRLKEYTAAYVARPEARQLPSWWEWVGMSLLTRPSRWKAPERAMMRAATLYHALRSAIVVAATAALSAVVYDRITATRADGLVHALATSDSRDVPRIVEQLREYGWWANPRIASRLAAQDQGPDERTRLLLGSLAVGGSPTDELAGRLLDADPPLCLAIADSMQSVGALKNFESRFRTVALDAELPRARRLRACVALARLESAAKAESWGPLARDAATLLRADVAQNPRYFDIWVDGLAPVKRWLIKPLCDSFTDATLDSHEQVLLAEILAKLAADDASQLVELALRSTPRQFLAISRALAVHADVIRDGVARDAVATAPVDSSDEDKDRRVSRQANAILLLKDLGNDEHFWPALQYRPDPRLRSFLLRHFREVAPPADWAQRLATETDPGIRQAMILTVGWAASNGGLPARPPGLQNELVRIFRDDPDAGVHSATHWALEKLGDKAQLDGALTELSRLGIRSGYHWYITKSRITMIIVDPPGKVILGSPNSEIGRDASDEQQWTCNLNWSFAISATEITQAQYFDVCPNYLEHHNESASEPQCPANVVSAIEAEDFCRRLSVRDGLTSEEPDTAAPAEGGTVSSSKLQTHRAYRLPTEAEWEVACRGGTITARSFGSSPELLPYYACYIGNSGACTWTVGHGWPNAWGLFDMLGNVSEWCQDMYVTNLASPVESRNSAPPLRSLTYLAVRGSDFNSLARMVRAANRRSIQAKDKAYSRGFRIARALRFEESHE